MGVFDRMAVGDHEQLVFVQDRASGLRGIIGIHSTVLGPALGGLRMWPYKTEDEAINDVLRLSEGMTYKAAASGLNLGGGKAVIIGDPRTDKTPEVFRAMGRAIERLGGSYITAEDVGTCPDDMSFIRETTQHVTGLSRAEGGSGDPSPTTAAGVQESIVACLEAVNGAPAKGDEVLDGVRVAVQGVGHVGGVLCRNLAAKGARLTVCDINAEQAERVSKQCGATVVAPEAIYDVEADVFAPCGLGAILNDETIPRLKCRVVAGAANNQLADIKRHGPMLEQRRILYAPDYVANAGGLINIYYRDILGRACDTEAWSPTGIYDTMKTVLRVASERKVPTYQAAQELAGVRIEEARRSKMAQR
ncbi:MAG: Glu/Leu/Phe/Val dehydrogenase [Verrucomicrobia bacterium]|nr:Glu/Leu/Phe/Val dehydrogenase [Verrucomicrobiota bacterium]